MKRVTALVACAAALLVSATAHAQEWNSAGLEQSALDASKTPSGPAPRRDLTGIWDAGGNGIAGAGHESAPWTDWGKQKASSFKPGNGPRAVYEADINDPLSTVCDPTGFPRQVLYETRPFQIVQTPNQVLILYMFERRWRTIWTDGRALPKDPDPRWYGYSVGRWEDDTTFVVQTVGMDERTWLDNAGNPHSGDMKVEERYHRVSRNRMELTVTIDDPRAYTKPWLGRDKMPLTLAPANLDMMEMICSPTEVMDYRKFIDDRTSNRTDKK
jgi:hypothetical protein